MRATVLLPLPLSPTSAVIVPGRSVKLTSSTARSSPKSFVSPRTSSSAVT